MTNLVDPISVNAFGSSAHWPKPVQFEKTAEQRVTAATMPGGSLVLSKVMSPSGPRPGCDDHRQHRSHGHGC